MKQLNNVTWVQPRPTPVQLPDGAEIEQQVPQRPATVHSDVGVPCLQAVITGGVIASLVTLVLWELVEAPILKTWGILTLAVTSMTWLVLLGETRKLLWGVERLTGLDLDGDGARGNPAKRTIRVELQTSPGSTQYIRSDQLEIDDDRLIHFAAGVIRGRSLAEGEWGKDKATFPRGINEYRAFRIKLTEAGLIRQVNPHNTSSPYQLSPSGRAVFARLAEDSPTRSRARANDPGMRGTSRDRVGGSA